jgi:hypothetical protein
VARSDELKERALRRRAARIVARLASLASAEASRQKAEDEARIARAHAVGQATAKLERDADAVAEHLAASLAPHAEAWARDLELVYVGRDRASTRTDPVLARYRVDRAMAALTPPLARALASLAPQASLSPSQLAPFARALVRAAASAASPDPESLLPPLSRAAVATLVDQLFALSVSPPLPTRAPGLLRELDALALALA